MLDEQVQAFKASPYWQYVLTFEPTMPSEIWASMGHAFDAGRFASLKMSALFSAGSESADGLTTITRQRRAYMPQAESVTLEGQGHGAILVVPKLFTDIVLEFLSR